MTVKWASASVIERQNAVPASAISLVLGKQQPMTTIYELLVKQDAFPFNHKY